MELLYSIKLISNNMKGFTLIEVLIYMFLISLIINGSIYTMYGIHVQNIKLMQTITDAYTT